MYRQRFSFQREQIYEAVCSTAEHPTAEMVYQWLKPTMPRLSLGTVYRNLHQMATDGRIMELSGTVVRYDANTHPHTHLQCTHCGALCDLQIPYDAALDHAAQELGCQIRDHHLTFYGVCPTCSTEREN